MTKLGERLLDETVLVSGGGRTPYTLSFDTQSAVNLGRKEILDKLKLLPKRIEPKLSLLQAVGTIELLDVPVYDVTVLFDKKLLHVEKVLFLSQVYSGLCIKRQRIGSPPTSAY